MKNRAVITIALVLLSAGFLYAFPIWNFQRVMAPYLRLERTHATEAQVVAEMGKPDHVLRRDAELSEWFHDFRPDPKIEPHVVNKVFVYYADPWNDGGGHVLYVVIGKDGTTEGVALGSH